MKSEDNSEGNEALCEVYAFLLQRRRLRLAQEAQPVDQTQQQTLTQKDEKEMVVEEQSGNQQQTQYH